MDNDYLNMYNSEILNRRNFLYPPFTDIEDIGVRGIYLGNYIRWDPYAQHLQMVKKFNFKGKKISRTFDCYDYCDSLLYFCGCWPAFVLVIRASCLTPKGFHSPLGYARLTNLGVMNVLSLYLLLGIGVDDLYVMADAFRQASRALLLLD